MNGTGSTRMVRSVLTIFVFVSFQFLLAEAAFSQGETTSAIVGQVSDASGAAVAGAPGTITSNETRLRRSARTAESGRFNFTQLKPRAYPVKGEPADCQPH